MSLILDYSSTCKSVEGGTVILVQLFHFTETYDELHVIPSFAGITVHEEAVDLVVEVLPAEIQ